MYLLLLLLFLQLFLHCNCVLPPYLPILANNNFEREDLIESLCIIVNHSVHHSRSRIISTDEDPSIRIESSAIINLRGVSTKLNKYK